MRPIITTTHDSLMQLPKYDRIVIYLFRELIAQIPGKALPKDLVFTKADVEKAMREAVADRVIDQEVKNVADIKYTYDARRELPEEVEQFGPMTWLQAGKSKYKFRRTNRKNIIDLSQFLDENQAIEPIVDGTPPFISSLLGEDEQAVFTRVRNCGLWDTIFGHKVWPIQGHHRTTVSYGQIEIDEVQAGIGRGGNGFIAPISGKGGQDKLSWSQALNLNTYGKEKCLVQGLDIRSIGLWRDHQNTIWVIEFSPETDIDEITIRNVRRFKFQLKFR